MTEHITKARRAHRAIVAALAAVEAAEGKLRELQAADKADRAERDRLQAEADTAEALRALDGDEAAAPDGGHSERLATLAKAIPARTAAIKMQQDRVAEAEAALRAIRVDLADPVIRHVSEMQQAAVDRVREKLAELAPDFAALVAADQIRDALLSERFIVPDGCPMPIGGRFIFDAFAEHLPKRLQVENLRETTLSAAREMAGQAITNITGEKS